MKYSVYIYVVLLLNIHVFVCLFPLSHAGVSVTCMYWIPLVLLGGLHVCAVTQPDLPKPARLASRLPASSRPRTRGCTEVQAL